MNWRSFTRGHATRSRFYGRENWSQGQVWTSVDRNDLTGTVFGETNLQRTSKTTYHDRNWDPYYGQTRGEDQTTPVGLPAAYVGKTGCDTYRRTTSPAERTWINMKRAMNDEDDYDYAMENTRRLDEANGFRTTNGSQRSRSHQLASPWLSEGRTFEKKYQGVYSPSGNHFNASNPWTGLHSYEQPYNDVSFNEHGYNPGPGETYYASPPSFPDDNYLEYEPQRTNDRDYDRQRRQPIDNFYPDKRWLECPAQRCPAFNGTFARDTNQFPGRDETTDSTFYHNYLESSEIQEYEENHLSNEKRKEKSRDAARCRRSKETDIFMELATALPMATDQATHLDKASVMRLAIAYLKIRRVVDTIPVPLAKPEPSPEMDGLFLKALDGFMIVLSSDGDIVYLSENVSEYLGVSQMDMMGQNVYDYSHPCDHEELRECLSAKPKDDEEKHTCNFFLRLKCTLTNKGRKVNLKSASYKVIHCTGHMVMNCEPPVQVQREDSDETSQDSDFSENGRASEKEAGGCLVVVGCPIPHPSNIEVPLGRQTFLSKHNLNMKFTYADEKLAEYLGWDTNELVGQSVFDFHHALDNPVLDKHFKSLFSKGQCETAAYRFLGKTGGFAWVVTQATLIHCSKQHKPQSVVCVNYILSGIECQNEVYSTRQLEARSVNASSTKKPLPSSVIPVAVLATVLNTNDNSGPENDSNNNNDKVEKTNDEENESRLLSGVKNVAVPIVPISVTILERPRPSVVTDSLFRQFDKISKQLPLLDKNIVETGNDCFQKPASAPIVKKNCEKSNSERQKENSTLPKANSFGFIQTSSEPFFQGQPFLEYTPPDQRQINRPRAVTSSLFSPAPIQESHNRPPPQTATASIFAPRTEDMNKGFLTFSEDQPGLTMLKDEPEDLTHLAPTPGDVCVPLEDTPFLTDMLDEFILANDNYCPLLSPGLPNDLRAPELGDSPLKDSDLVDPLRTNELGDALPDSDPFMYRDTPSPCSGTPNLLSPALSKSPESIDSLCSPNGSGGGLSEDEMLMLGIDTVLADDELELRAPYIPMSDQDETLALLISDDMVMWGPSQPPDKKLKWSNAAPESNGNSHLEQLLRTTPEQLLRTTPEVKKYHDHGGGILNVTDTFEQTLKKKIKEESWTLKSERSQKRLHATPNFEPDTKRIKSEESNATEALRSCQTDSETNLNVRSNNSDSREGSQLLQQLITQRAPKYRSSGHGYPTNDDGGGVSNSSSLQQQSNSVLMNLLVSGCDATIDARNIPPLLQQKISPLSVNLENHMVNQMSLSTSLQHLSPDTRKELINSLPRNKVINATQELISMDLENFDFDENSMNPELLPGSDLLKALVHNLV